MCGWCVSHLQVFACCDPEDFKLDFKDSKMNAIIDRHANTLLLHVTVPPPPRKKIKSSSSVDPRELIIQPHSVMRTSSRPTLTSLSSSSEPQDWLSIAQLIIHLFNINRNSPIERNTVIFKLHSFGSVIALLFIQSDMNGPAQITCSF